MVREIRVYPDEVLRKRAEEVKEFDEELKALVKDMFDTMYEKGGIGLAANQIGVLKRVIVIDVKASSENPEEREQRVFINPEIVSSEGELFENEGCLSLPGLFKRVKRAAKVKVKAQDVDGNEFELEAEGLLSRALQHEIDHLNGVLFIDRLSPIQRRLALEKYKKLKKKREREGR